MQPATAPFPHVAWSRNANLYQVNLRQFTPEGSFSAFQRQLPRLHAMGVACIWLMPIHPIGTAHRKGSLGSPYAVSDHTAVNPEFGTLADLQHLVRAVHALGMRLIIDWVPNHTAWDHRWASEHPDWYRRDADGRIRACEFHNGTQVELWSDVIALDYEQPALRQAMIDAMLFWLREADVDGFRCDVAGLLPTSFWNQARRALDGVKPVFMLAEWSAADLHEQAFDASYAWDLYDTMRDIAAGRDDARAIPRWMAQQRAIYPPDAYRMLFTSNHDKNAWIGSDSEIFGPSFKAFAVLAATLPGLPLIYGGQEAGLDRRLAFFEKDPIVWKGYPLQDFYRELLACKRQHPALWNGQYGGGIEFLPGCGATLLGYRRSQGADEVTVWLNLCDTAQAVQALGGRMLPAWGYEIVAAPRAAAPEPHPPP